jgi:hypothetical protein
MNFQSFDKWNGFGKGNEHFANIFFKKSLQHAFEIDFRWKHGKVNWKNNYFQGNQKMVQFFTQVEESKLKIIANNMIKTWFIIKLWLIFKFIIRWLQNLKLFLAQ